MPCVECYHGLNAEMRGDEGHLRDPRHSGTRRLKTSDAETVVTEKRARVVQLSIQPSQLYIYVDRIVQLINCARSIVQKLHHGEYP